MEKQNAYSVEVSYLVPQNHRGFIEAESEEAAIKELIEAAKKQGYLAFKVTKITQETLEVPAESPSSAQLN